MIKITALILAVLALGGCTDATKAALGVGVEKVREGNDSAAALAIQAPCSMTIGAFNRVLSPEQKRAVMVLCGGETSRPVTVEDLQRFLNR